MFTTNDEHVAWCEVIRSKCISVIVLWPYMVNYYNNFITLQFNFKNWRSKTAKGSW